MKIKNCYFPSKYDFISTEYGYDIYDKKIKDILELNEYLPNIIYVHMVVCAPNSCKKDEIVETMNFTEEWNGKTHEWMPSYEWQSDWCEGQTDVCIMGIYTDAFIDDLCLRYSHKYRYSGEWITV